MDESTDSDQAGSHAHAVPEPDRASPQRSPNRLFRGCLVLIVAVIVSMAGIWMLFVRIDASLHPQAGPADRAYARQVAQEAADHLGHNPLVTSAPSASSEAATPSDISAHVNISLKDGTRKITLTVSMSWTLGGTSIAADFDASRATTDIISTTTRDLTPVGEARTIRQGGSSLLGIDYGEVGSPPASLANPSGSRTWKSFTMNGWHVTSTSNETGQFATPPMEQIIAAATQTSTTGSITFEADPGSMSVTGLATDDGGLSPEAAAPVVHALSDCHAAGLTELNLNTTTGRHGPWRTLICQGRTWTPKDDGVIGQQEAAILNKAAEL